MKISIIIPCYNEEKTLYEIYQKVNNFDNFEKEIIIIDDCSKDNTQKVISKIKDENPLVKTEKHENNLGKGGGIRTGLKLATGNIVLIQDADLEYDPFDYNKLLLPFFETDADVVYGSRFLGGGKYVRIHFFWHYLANKILTFLCNLFINLNAWIKLSGLDLFFPNIWLFGP